MIGGIRDTAGFVAGLLFLAIGAAAILIARGYPVGSALHMGPGYFPVVIGVGLVLTGLASVIRSLMVTAHPGDRIALRPLLGIVASVLIFAAAIDTIGLVPSVLIAAFVAGLARPSPNLTESALIAVILSVLAAGIFSYGLKLPFALF